MSFSYNEAIDEMLKPFRDAWVVGAGYRAIYEDVAQTDDKGGPPKGHTPWARVMVRMASAGQASLGGKDQKRWNRTGVITVQVFTEVGKGLSASRAAAKIVTDAYEGKATPGGVWFRNVRPVEAPADGDFAQVNVVIEFTYDEVR